MIAVVAECARHPATSRIERFGLRRTALTNAIPYYTTVAGARAATQGIAALQSGSLEVTPLQAYS